MLVKVKQPLVGDLAAHFPKLKIPTSLFGAFAILGKHAVLLKQRCYLPQLADQVIVDNSILLYHDIRRVGQGRNIPCPDPPADSIRNYGWKC
jgi:hypothetical protein